MSDDLNELFEFALDFYRAPLQHQRKLKLCRAYSSSFTRLLEIVSRGDTTDDLKEVASELGKSPETLASAALFLVRQMLFTEKGNYYEILGLRQTASKDEIKKRYRTLISLFHPDKNPEGEEWSQLYSPDLNQAYNALKNESKRSQYDLTLDTGQRARNPDSPRSGRQRPIPAANPYSAAADSSNATSGNQSRGTHRPRTKSTTTPHYDDASHSPGLWQQHPQLIIWGSALSVLALVIIVISLRSPDYSIELSSNQSADDGDYKRSATADSDGSTAVNGTGDALKFALMQSESTYQPPALSQPDIFTKNEIPAQNNRVDPVAEQDVGAVINQYMTDEQRAELSVKYPNNELPKNEHPKEENLEEKYSEQSTEQNAEQNTDKTVNRNVKEIADENVDVQNAMAKLALKQKTSVNQKTTNTATADAVPAAVPVAVPVADKKDTAIEKDVALAKVPATSPVKKADVVVASIKTEKPAITEKPKAVVAAEVIEPAKTAKKPAAVKPTKETRKTEAKVKPKVITPKVITPNTVVASVTKVSAPEQIKTAKVGAAKEPVSAFSEERVEFLLAQYITAYDSGNLQQLTGLFTADVVTEGGTGVDILKKDYIKLFQKTAERSMVIQNVENTSAEANKTNKTNKANIKFQAYIQVRKHFSIKWKKYSGKMKFTVVSSDEGLKISSLTHTVTKVK